MKEWTLGIGGAAGDGLDKAGDTLAKTASRAGLHVYAYNSYQSVIRGGHIWLKVRISEKPLSSHGDHLHALIALNQDSIERHAQEIEPGGALIYNADRFQVNLKLPDRVAPVGLPMAELTKDAGHYLPIMQNTVLLGALLYLAHLDFEAAAGVLKDTFGYKGQQVIDQNVGLLRAGFEYAKKKFQAIGPQWKFTNVRRPFLTGNDAFSLGAVAAGCKFYTAYPMTPATSILHWMAPHAEKCGIVAKQCEDELAVANMAIGAGYAGIRALCGTSGGGFALMTEAIGFAGMIEAPVVFIEVQRGGPSTGLPTKTEQADLNQVFGASQGDYPRILLAPGTTEECFEIIPEAFNLAEKYQLPVIVVSDLLLSEHPQTIEPEVLNPKVSIDRGSLLQQHPKGESSKGEPFQGEPFKRYRFTPSGISPRALPGTPHAEHVAASDEHDEEGILISDVFTSPALRRKIVEKRRRKLEGALQELAPPRLEGPQDAEVTLIGWGSTRGVIAEAIQQLAGAGLQANQLHIKYLHPFHEKETSRILARCAKTIVVENSASGQFARFLRAETGHTAWGKILKYDGEPFEPRQLVSRVQGLLQDRPLSPEVTEQEAREIASHYLRTHSGEQTRPAGLKRLPRDGKGEAVWQVDVVERDSGEKRGELRIGIETGATCLKH